MILKEVIPSINRKFGRLNIIIANVAKYLLLDKKYSQIHSTVWTQITSPLVSHHDL